MEKAIFKILAPVAGIGGIALGVFLLIFRDVIRKSIFPNLTRIQAYKIIRLVLFLTFAIALSGIGAWVWSISINSVHVKKNEEEGSFRRIYYEGFDNTDVDSNDFAAKFGDIWQIGKRGDWEGELFNGKYRLCNIAQDPTSSFTNRLTYYMENGCIAEMSNCKVTVKVRIDPPYSTFTGAGIRFRSSPKREDYLAFVLNAGQSVSLFRRYPETIKILWSGEISLPTEGEFTSLKVIGRSNEIDLYVNNNLVHTAKNVELIDGEPGIMAYSTGCFIFDDFVIYQRIDLNT